jgi:hypothetical protein
MVLLHPHTLASKLARLHHHFLELVAIVAIRVLTIVFFELLHFGPFSLLFLFFRSASLFLHLLGTSVRFCQYSTVVALVDSVFFILDLDSRTGGVGVHVY